MFVTTKTFDATIKRLDAENKALREKVAKLEKLTARVDKLDKLPAQITKLETTPRLWPKQDYKTVP